MHRGYTMGASHHRPLAGAEFAQLVQGIVGGWSGTLTAKKLHAKNA